MKPFFFLSLILLFSIASAATQYSSLDSESTIMELDEYNNPIEKRIALATEISAYTETKTTKTTTLTDYNRSFNNQSIIKIVLTNNTNKTLSNVSVVQIIPSIVFSQGIKSDYNYELAERKPVILVFKTGNLKPNQQKDINFSIEFTETQKTKIETALDKINPPIITILLEPDSCLGINCNNNNPCTIGYCANRNCLYQNKNDGTPCADGYACTQGECKKYRQETIWVNTCIIIILTVEAFALTISIKNLKKNQKKEQKKEWPQNNKKFS